MVEGGLRFVQFRAVSINIQHIRGVQLGHERAPERLLKQTGALSAALKGAGINDGGQTDLCWTSIHTYIYIVLYIYLVIFN